ncbi:LysR family transcriptional regulator [Geothermobacter ehrlichii]|uniref:LysR family transcriptional regulator n=1 Tax=Geothermobacter ehrlichii TaxID=213224 RepID=A0A5D3WL48_9BACT|nr:selenium metabolism-associated LysR family transcriptional regulator [Geothermobacter ehrlichii]TYO98830.1 LysR family transcriptional regulator [Geothermobacter ehrlichii]
MDIKRLDLFCKVVELKSFTRAAAEAGLSQPSVSEHIRLLEETVGEKLLDRLGRQVVPTPAGQKLYPYARRIVRLRDESLQAMAAFRSELAGDLLIGASTIPGTYILPQAIQPFHAHHPRGRLTVRITGSEGVQQQVMSGEIELGVVGSRGSDPRRQFEALCEDRLVLAVPADHPWAGRDEIAVGELSGQPFIRREPGSGTRQMTEAALREAGLAVDALDIVAELGSSEAVRQAVRSGAGVAVLSLHSVREDVARGELAALGIRGMKDRRTIWLMTRRGRRLSPLAEVFAEHLRQWCAECCASL